MLDNMDDDTQRTLKIKVGGNEYPAAPFEQAQVMALQMVRDVEPATVIKILSGLVKFSLGPAAQSDVLVMLATGEIDEHGLIKVLMDIAKATAEAKEAERSQMAELTKTAPPAPYGDDAETRNPLVPETFTGPVKPGAY